MRERPSSRWLPQPAKPVLAGILALGLLGFMGGSATTSTEATWTDQELSQGQFTTLVVPSPTATKECTYQNNAVHLYWTLPSGYELADMTISASSDGLGAALELSAEHTKLVPGRDYETTMSSRLLGELLGLNAVWEVAIITEDGTWKSAPLKFEASPGLALGIGSYCKNL